MAKEKNVEREPFSANLPSSLVRAFEKEQAKREIKFKQDAIEQALRLWMGEPTDGTVPVPVPKPEKNGNRHKSLNSSDSLNLLSRREVQWIQILRDQPKLADALLELVHGRKDNSVPVATPADLEKRVAKLSEKQDPPRSAPGGARNTGT